MYEFKFSYMTLFLVEMRGIEPLSENQSIQASPSAANLFKFPHPTAGGRADGFGSLSYNSARETIRRNRSPLIDALSTAVVLRGRTAA